MRRSDCGTPFFVFRFYEIELAQFFSTAFFYAWAKFFLSCFWAFCAFGFRFCEICGVIGEKNRGVLQVSTENKRNEKMRVEKTLNQDVLAGAVAMLQRHVPDLTPTSLVNALTNYGEEVKRPAPMGKPLTRREAAELLSLSLVSLDKLIKAGRLHASRIGRRVLIDAEAIRNIMREGEA